MRLELYEVGINFFSAVIVALFCGDTTIEKMVIFLLCFGVYCSLDVIIKKLRE